MKLSDLVYYRNRLDEIAINQIQNRSLREFDHVRYVVTETGMNVGDHANKMRQAYQQATQSVENLREIFEDLKATVDLQIAAREPEYLAESTRLYEQDMCWESNEYILNRRLAIDDDSNIMLRSRLKSVTDWRIPGMIIRPGLENFVEDLVPMDPLYLVDHDQDLLTPTLDQFNEVYRRRLRPYVVSESRPRILAALPQGQFGLVFAYNFFNYKPWPVMQRWLEEIAGLLRPGGTLLFTYNNCDRGHGVALCEASFMCYTPRHKVVAAAENFGLDLTHEHTGLGDLGWLEFRRPGQIASIRGSQPLAKIVNK